MHGKSLLTIIILFWLLVVGESKVYLVLDLVKTIVSLSPLLWDGSFLLITLDISYFGVEAEKLRTKKSNLKLCYPKVLESTSTIVNFQEK